MVDDFRLEYAAKHYLCIACMERLPRLNNGFCMEKDDGAYCEFCEKCTQELTEREQWSGQ